MRETRAGAAQPRLHETDGTAGETDVTPIMRSGDLPDFMTYGLRASIALFLGATRSAPASDDVDPADLYGDFA
jgi:hypothetical protein